jgi:hypothetical protein
MKTPQPQTIRRSVIAGSWYPGSPESLARAVDGYLSQVDQPPVSGKLVGLISPHAGYVYSGQTAAYAYGQLEKRSFATVVLLGPSHRAWVGDWAVSSEDAYETPLGRLALDHPFIGALEERIHLNHIRQDGEHSLEIQLPFLQRQLGEFKLVPILMNADEPVAVGVLARALADTIRAQPEGQGQVLLVASSDLHHIENYDEVVRRDRRVVEAIAAYDLEQLVPLLMAPSCSVCGRMPILTVLQAARRLGADSVRVLHHTNSGDVTGQRTTGQYTVGYMAAAVYQAN